MKLQTRLIVLTALLAFGSANAADRPNILWLFAEDTSPWMGCYGDPINKGKTPNIDSLAERGVTLRDLDKEEAELPRFSEDLDDFDTSESRRHASAGEEDDEPLNWGGLENNREEDEQAAPRRATARTEDTSWESWA